MPAKIKEVDRSFKSSALWRTASFFTYPGPKRGSEISTRKNCSILNNIIILIKKYIIQNNSPSSNPISTQQTGSRSCCKMLPLAPLVEKVYFMVLTLSSFGSFQSLISLWRPYIGSGIWLFPKESASVFPWIDILDFRSSSISCIIMISILSWYIVRISYWSHIILYRNGYWCYK